MDVYRFAEKLMRMRAADWHRHASPWSVWTRFTCLPLIALAIFARAWIGWWSVPLLLLALFWTWANPRAFPAPRDFGAWSSRGTLGERIFLDRAAFDVPAHHVQACHMLTALSAVGLIPLIYGLIALEGWATVTGLIAVILPKVWFVDRMVWLHADLTRTVPGTSLTSPHLLPERTS